MDGPNVKVCDKIYSNSDSTTKAKLEAIFSKYPFELDHFQKYAIQAIEEGCHILTTAHTGSGKVF